MRARENSTGKILTGTEAIRQCANGKAVPVLEKRETATTQTSDKEFR